jgi:hypothetical protein
VDIEARVNADLERIVPGWLSLPELADRLGEPVSKVRHRLREGRLVAVERGVPPTLQVPADFVCEGELVKGLCGTLTLLRDNGYTAAEALHWLFTPDDSLPGTPINALAANRGSEVKRRAQALGF